MGDAIQVLQRCLLLNSYSQGKSPPCVYCAPLVRYHSLVFVSEFFSWTHLSLVFAVPGVACGSSSFRKKNKCSLEVWVSRAGSSMAELLLSEIFLGSQNQLCFLHTYATLPLIKYYARQIVFRNLHDFIVFTLCWTGTSSIALRSSDLHVH